MWKGLVTVRPVNAQRNTNYMREASSILETERLRLREFVPADLDAVARVLGDPETMRYYPQPFDRAGVAAWIERNRVRYHEHGHGLWALVLKSSGEVVGDCGLIRLRVEERDEIEVGYHVRKDLWNQGLATESARACRDYGFRKLGVGRLISLIRPENIPSRRVAEKNGMSIWKEVVWADLTHLVYTVTAEGRPG